MTIRDFNSIYSSQTTNYNPANIAATELVNAITTNNTWDNKFEGLTLFNSQVSVTKSLFAENLYSKSLLTCGSNLTVNGTTTLKNDININGNFNLTGDATIISGVSPASGDYALTIISSTSDTSGSDPTTPGALNVNGRSYMLGSVSIDGVSAASGDYALTIISATGSTGSTGTSGVVTTTPGALDVTGYSLFNGALDVKGPSNLLSNDYVVKIATNNSSARKNALQVSGDSNFVGGNDDAYALSVSSTVNGGAFNVTGYSEFISRNNVKPALTIKSFTPCGEALNVIGDVNIDGNFVVSGTKTIINSTDLEIKDINITLAKGSSSKLNSNGAGISIELGLKIDPATGQVLQVNGAPTTEIALASVVYENANDNFFVNKQIRQSVLPVNNADLSNKKYVDDRVASAGNTIINNSLTFDQFKGFKLKVIDAITPFINTDIDLDFSCVLYVLNRELASVSIDLPTDQNTVPPTANYTQNVENATAYRGLNMFVYDRTATGQKWTTSV
jgi:hypothetical protein